MGFTKSWAFDLPLKESEHSILSPQKEKVCLLKLKETEHPISNDNEIFLPR